MRLSRSDAHAGALLALFALVLVGMLLGEWRLVLYPALLSFGVLLAMSQPARRRVLSVGLPVTLCVLLFAGYGLLDVMSVSAPTAAAPVAGLHPTTAVYAFGITPVFLLVGLAYAATFRTEVAR